jgi:hypothetical protein
MLHKDYERKVSDKKKKTSGRELEGAWRQNDPNWRQTTSRKATLSFDLSSVGRRWSAGNALGAEAKQFPLLEAVTRKRQVQELQAGKT